MMFSKTMRNALLAFSACLLARAIVHLAFVARFSNMAVRHVETWFYCGVMNGNTAYGLHAGAWDPAYFILRIVGYASGCTDCLYHTLMVSFLLQAAGCGLLAFLAGEIAGPKQGLYAGLCYAGLLNAGVLGLTGFTHDTVQIPLVLLALNLYLLGVRKASPGWLALSFAIIGWSAFANQTAYVAVGAMGSDLGYRIVSKFW